MDSQSQDDDYSWCSEYFNKEIDNLLGKFWSEEEEQLEENESYFLTLNCFNFKLDQEEFKKHDIRSANVYYKLDMNSLSDLIFYPPDLISESNRGDIDTNFVIYIQINGKIAKKIDLSSALRDIEIENYKKSEFELPKKGQIFDFIDIKDIIQSELDEINSQNKKTKFPTINVKLLCKSGLLNFTKSEEKLLRLFSEIEETFALHVKLDEQISNVLPAGRRMRRAAKLQNAKTRRYSKQHGKSYRDCGDLKKAGFSQSNYSCCRETISFSMEQLGWSHWILSPKVIEYKYCRGGCLCKS
jgi:hypothetical protein